MLGLPAGGCLSYLITGPLAQSYGWRVPFFVACLPGLLLAALCLGMREPERGTLESTARPSPSQGEPGKSVDSSSIRLLLRMPALWWIVGSGVFYNFNLYALNSFLTALLMRGHGLDLKTANQVSAVVLGAFTAVGLLAGGWIGDRAHRWRNDGRLLLAGAAMVVSCVFVFAALRQPMRATVPFVALLGVGMIFAYFYYGPVYSTIQDLVEPRLRGRAMALYFFGMYVLGASFGPVGTGVLSDHFAQRALKAAGATDITDAHRAVGLHDAMYVIPLLSLLAAVTL